MRIYFAIGLLVLSSNVFGCSCAIWPEDPYQATKEAYELYPVIFLGTAKSVKMLSGTEEIQETEFSVHKRWKGTGSSNITTRISIMCCICGYEFEKGVTYLVFAEQRDDGSYRVSMCSLTLPEERAASYVEALDRFNEN